MTYIPDVKYLPINIFLLDLSSNHIQDFGNGSLSEMRNLKHLNLSCNVLQSLPQGLLFPRSLTHLNISSNFIKTFGKNPFENIPFLEKLDLYDNKLKYNGLIFYTGLFEHLRKLKYLNIGFNGYGTTNPMYPDETFCDLTSLQTLKIDCLAGASFGKGFKYLTKLRFLKVFNVGLEGYSSDFFENVSQITSLDLSCPFTLPYDNENGCFFQMDRGTAISKLENLKYLDISNNLKLGFCGLRNITYDLTKTNIKVLIAKKITCPYGYSTVLFTEDIKPLGKTQIREIYIDQNRLEILEEYAASHLPKSLRLLSLNYNRLRLDKYKHGIFNLTGIHSLFLNYQDEQSMNDFSHWWVCYDLKETLECLSRRVNAQRYSDTKQSNMDKNEVTFLEKMNLS